MAISFESAISCRLRSRFWSWVWPPRIWSSGTTLTVGSSHPTRACSAVAFLHRHRREVDLSVGLIRRCALDRHQTLRAARRPGCEQVVGNLYDGGGDGAQGEQREHREQHVPDPAAPAAGGGCIGRIRWGRGAVARRERRYHRVDRVHDGDGGVVLGRRTACHGWSRIPPRRAPLRRRDRSGDDALVALPHPLRGMVGAVDRGARHARCARRSDSWPSWPGPSSRQRWADSAIPYTAWTQRSVRVPTATSMLSSHS